ncbi:unnamed protein product, partial [Polarella glacialis]
ASPAGPELEGTSDAELGSSRSSRSSTSRRRLQNQALQLLPAGPLHQGCRLQLRTWSS